MGQPLGYVESGKPPIEIKTPSAVFIKVFQKPFRYLEIFSFVCYNDNKDNYA